VVAILGGETSALFATIPSAYPHFKSGKLIPLGVTSSKRNAALPDIPSLAEAGVTGYETFEWQGLMAPAGTPRPVIDRLQHEFAKALALPDMKDKLAGIGADPVGSTPEELAAYIRREFTTWSKVIKEAGIRIE
jgi:tripartite-type tricarboxylate transporter receptor subunit TctC